MRETRRRFRMKPSEALAVAALCLGLLAATSPAWRVMMLGDQPTLKELLQVTCGIRRR